MTTPSSPETPPAPPQGPYKEVRTSTIKLSAIEFSSTTTVEASHPPAPCGCHGKGKEGGSLEEIYEIVGQYGGMIMKAITGLVGQGQPPAAAPDAPKPE